ncbi:hypothetical protein [Streptomyces coelicoflavus]|uniref:hypothetical protein n=1 Tax=Streptomyces coelicoflavus TaxID=285562 RepID=UPI000D59A75E|nr:hypothetical protein [Streptomyces coelicoflavus]
MTARTTQGSPDATTAPGRPRVPGQWPTPSTDEIGPTYAALMRERARRVLVMQSIRASLQEQPSLRAVLACARRWVADVTRTADEVAKSKRETRK